MSNYYVSGCIGDGDAVATCDDDVAQFWTIYHRNGEGLSEGIIDCMFREDAEAAMKVYVERDALQQKLNAAKALAGVAGDMNGVVKEGFAEVVAQRYAVAAENKLLDNAIGAIADAHATGVADLLAAEINAAVNIEAPATEAARNAIRAEGVIMFASKQLAASSDLESTITLERLMLDAEELAGQLRMSK